MFNMLNITESQISPLAKVLLAKLNDLQFSCKGKEPVIDQAFELVAALGGYRNQHAMRATLAEKVSAAATVAMDLKGITPEAKAVLERKGFRVGLSYYMRAYWLFGDLGANDFDTVGQAWSFAWDHAVTAAKVASHISDSDWVALGVSGQLAMVDVHVPAAELQDTVTSKDAVADGKPLEAAELDDDNEKAVALGFKTGTQMREHAGWLKKHGTPEYKEWLAEIERFAADETFEDFNFGPDLEVIAHNGWESNGDGEYVKSVFLDDRRMLRADSIRVRFSVHVVNGKAVSCSVSN